MIQVKSGSPPRPGPGGMQNKGAPNSFEETECLLYTIRSVLADSRPTMISCSEGRVLIDPTSRLYCEAIPDRAAFFETSPDAVRITRHKPGPGGTWRPVEELLWEAAYHGPPGSLLAPLNPLTAVRLVRWPNLTRVSHTPAMITLCALLHKRALSTAVATRMLRAPESEAWRFFSAALASGLARQIGEIPKNPETHADSQSGASRRVSSFWSQLFAKLSGG